MSPYSLYPLTIKQPLKGKEPSLIHLATSTARMGDLIHLAHTHRIAGITSMLRGGWRQIVPVGSGSSSNNSSSDIGWGVRCLCQCFFDASILYSPSTKAFTGSTKIHFFRRSRYFPKRDHSSQPRALFRR